MIKLITFDLDDTLWAIRPVINRASQLLLEWATTYAPKFADTYGIQGLEALRDEVMQNNPTLSYDLNLARKNSIKLGLVRCGYTASQAADLTQQGFDVYFTARNQVTLFPETKTQLHQLKSAYKIGALTNGNADLKLVGLNAYFDFYLSASQVKSAKPDPLMFYKALQYAQVEAHEVIHIGDDPIRDVAAARALGMHTIWVNIVPQTWPDNLPPSPYVITHLEQLDHTIQTIQTNLASPI